MVGKVDLIQIKRCGGGKGGLLWNDPNLHYSAQGMEGNNLNPRTWQAMWTIVKWQMIILWSMWLKKSFNLRSPVHWISCSTRAIARSSDLTWEVLLHRYTGPPMQVHTTYSYLAGTQVLLHRYTLHRSSYGGSTTVIFNCIDAIILISPPHFNGKGSCQIWASGAVQTTTI